METLSEQPKTELPVPEKFLNKETNEIRTDALLKSYLELEKKLNQPKEETTTNLLTIPASAQDYSITISHEMFTTDDEINQRLHEKGFSNEQAEFLYDLAAEKMVPLVLEIAQEFEAERQTDKLIATFGGKERFTEVSRQLLAYGKKNLPSEVLEGLASTYEGVMALYRLMQSGKPLAVQQPGENASVDENALRHGPPKCWPSLLSFSKPRKKPKRLWRLWAIWIRYGQSVYPCWAFMCTNAARIKKANKMNLLDHLTGSINLLSSKEDRAQHLNAYKTDLAETSMHTMQNVGSLLGFDLANDMVDHYQLANKKPLYVSPLKLRKYITITNAEEKNQNRLINSFTPQRLQNIRDNEEIILNDYYDVDSNPQKYSIANPDLAFGLGNFKLRSRSNLTLKRSGDKFLPYGYVDHNINNETYDFNQGSPYSGMTDTLEKAGKAHPYQVKSNWKTYPFGVIKIKDNQLDTSGLEWALLE